MSWLAYLHVYLHVLATYTCTYMYWLRVFIRATSLISSVAIINVEQTEAHLSLMSTHV